MLYYYLNFFLLLFLFLLFLVHHITASCLPRLSHCQLGSKISLNTNNAHNPQPTKSANLLLSFFVLPVLFFRWRGVLGLLLIGDFDVHIQQTIHIHILFSWQIRF